eukprot:Clim_evm82s210 gene=Clim_evmTU82s210
MASWITSVRDIYGSLQAGAMLTMALAPGPVAFPLWFAGKVLLLPFGRRAGYWWAGLFYGSYNALVVWLGEKFAGCHIIWTGDRMRPSENALYIANHQCTMDWVVAHFVAYRYRHLCDVRFLIKDELKYIPWYGMTFHMQGFIFVRRSWTYDSSRIIARLAHLRELGVPNFLCIFPEGTRFDPTNADKIERSQYATKRAGYPPLVNLLHPKTRGFITCLRELRGEVGYVYDITIGYQLQDNGSRGMPSMIDFLRGTQRRLAIHCQRFDVSKLPEDEDLQADWLMQRWQEKDALLEHYFKFGYFPGRQYSAPHPNKWPLMSWIMYTGLVVPLLFSSKYREMYMRSLVVSGLASSLIMLIV